MSDSYGYQWYRWVDSKRKAGVVRLSKEIENGEESNKRNQKETQATNIKTKAILCKYTIFHFSPSTRASNLKKKKSNRPITSSKI